MYITMILFEIDVKKELEGLKISISLNAQMAQLIKESKKDGFKLFSDWLIISLCLMRCAVKLNPAIND